jgi:hypothetical protein
MALGRFVAKATTAFAWSTGELPLLLADDDELAFVLSELELLLEPHPATAASAATRATAPKPRRYLLHADVSGDIYSLLLR